MGRAGQDQESEETSFFSHNFSIRRSISRCHNFLTRRIQSNRIESTMVKVNPVNNTASIGVSAVRPPKEELASKVPARNSLGKLVKKCAKKILQRRLPSGEETNSVNKIVFQLEDLPNIDNDVVEVEDRRVGNYSLLEKIGAGGFGAVFLARKDGANDDQVVAIKVQPNLTIKKKIMTEHLKVEYNVLKTQSHHPNIVGFHAAIYTPKSLVLVLEKVAFDLNTMIRKETWRKWKDSWSPQQPDFRQQIMTGILRAVSHLHELGIAHCDIKPHNVLIQTTALDENCVLIPGRRVEADDVRLCDFGISQFSSNYNGKPSGGPRDWYGWSKTQSLSVMRSLPSGTQAFGAPECDFKEGRKYEARHADIWCVGATLVDLVFRGSVFDTIRGHNFGRRRRGRFIWELRGGNHYTKKEARALYDLMFRRLAPMKPQHRLSAKMALKHSWFTAHRQLHE